MPALSTVSRIEAVLRQQSVKGLFSYGTSLSTHNGRNALRDASEELVDYLVYLRQSIEEQLNRRPVTVESLLIQDIRDFASWGKTALPKEECWQIFLYEDSLKLLFALFENGDI